MAAPTVVVVVLCALAACGKKGPPLAPLSLVPARVDDLSARRAGDEVQLQFTLPARNTTGSGAADLAGVDVFAVTGPLVSPRGGPLADADLVEVATMVASVEVAPPPAPDETSEEAATRPRDPRPKQGEKVTVRETITAAALQVPPAVAAPGTTPLPAGVVVPPVTPPRVGLDPPLERHYFVAGRNRRGKLGPLSPRVAVPMTRLPAPPPAPTVRYDEQGLAVEWPDPEGARQALQGEAGPGDLAATPIFAGPPARTYNVYAAASGPAAMPAPSAAAPAPLNPTPLGAPRFETREVRFGEERCFTARAVETHGAAVLESAPSPPTCVTPRDTFPPPAPRSLAAVGGEGAINLIWEGGGGADLAGYLVLRGEAGGGELQPLTSAPVRETTFRDTDVKAGTRYVYAIVSVDTAVPPNRSAESNRVEETAR